MILAGGESRRYGEDKAFALWDGVPFVTRVADALRNECHDLLVLGRAGADAKRYQAAVREARVRLDVASMAGPVAALRAALKDTKAQWILVAPCDAPAFTSDQAKQLLTAARAAKDTAVARISTGPLFDLFAAWAPKLSQRLEKATRLEDLTKGATEVELDSDLGLNVNEPTRGPHNQP